MAHQPRLTRALGELLRARRSAALGTLDANDGQPFVSMVPYAIDDQAPCLVLHVSGLAAHTHNMARDDRVSLLVCAEAPDGAPVHDLPRVTLEGRAHTPETDSPAWHSARRAYLARFPDVEPMTELPDFRFVCIALSGARQVAGFGAARSVDGAELAGLLADAAP